MILARKNIIKYTKTNLPNRWLFIAEKGWWMLNIYCYQVENNVRCHIIKTCDGKQWALTEWNQNHSSVQKQAVHLTQDLLQLMKDEYKIPAVYRRYSPCLVRVMTLGVLADSGHHCVCAAVIGRCLLELTESSPAACLLCKPLPPDGPQLPGSPLPTASDWQPVKQEGGERLNDV